MILQININQPHCFRFPEMQRLCADCGVALVLVPRIKKVPWHGATKWLSPHKAMILLSIRGKREDKFWFSFFHEAGHVLHDNKKNLYINNESKSDPVEARVDAYASNTLIPSGERTKIPSLNSKAQIIDFSKRIGVSPGIVAGQYQFLTKRWSYYNDLIGKLEWNTL